VVFDDRRLPLEVYDELMGILVHGCVGKPIGLRLGFQRGADVNIIDVITSKSSTLPYDDNAMRRMTRLVQAAKGTQVRYREKKGR
jgi:hypothetical protein